MVRKIPHVVVDGVECKACYCCEEVLDLTNFTKNKARADGLNSYCMPCIKKKWKELPKETKAAREQQKREYLDANRERRNEWCREYSKIPEVKQKKSEAGKLYKKNNKEKVAAYKKEYNAANKDKINKHRREHQKIRRQNDPQFKLRGLLSNRVNSALKASNTSKSISTMELIGCTVDFLRKYLKNQFEEGMTWENHGKDPDTCWHMDHIRPCDSFDLTDEDQQRECFHYSNLQPLWGRENMEKSFTWFPEDHIYHEEKTILEDGVEVRITWKS